MRSHDTPRSVYGFKLLYRQIESGLDLLRECRTILNESGEEGSAHYEKSVLVEYLGMLFNRIDQWRKQIVYCLSFKRIVEAGEDDPRVNEAKVLIERLDDAQKRLTDFVSH